MPKKGTKRTINRDAETTNETHVFGKSSDVLQKRRSARLVGKRQQLPSTHNDHDEDGEQLQERSGKRRYSESDVSDSDADYKPSAAAHSESEESSDTEVPVKKPKQIDNIAQNDIWDSDSEKKPFEIDRLAINLSDDESSSSDEDFESVDGSATTKHGASRGAPCAKSESSSQSEILVPKASCNDRSHESSNDMTGADDMATNNIFRANLEAISKIQKVYDNMQSKSTTEDNKKDCLQDVIADMLRENEPNKDCGGVKDEGKACEKKKNMTSSKQKKSAESSKAILAKTNACVGKKKSKKESERKQSTSVSESSGVRKTQAAMSSGANAKRASKSSCSTSMNQRPVSARKDSKRTRANEQQPHESETSDDLSESSDWEEVTASGSTTELDSYNPTIPREGVEITLQAPTVIRKRKRHKFDPEEHVRLQINRRRKAIQQYKHKVHLLCLLAWGLRINNVLLEEELHATALSLVPQEFHNYANRKTTYLDVDRLLKLFRRVFSYKVSSESDTKDISGALMVALSSMFTTCIRDYALLFLLIIRSLKIEGRLCVSLYPVALKTEDLLKPKPKPKESEDDSNSQDTQIDYKKPNDSKKSSKRLDEKERTKKKSHLGESCSDDDFKPHKHKVSKSKSSKMESRGKKKSGCSKEKESDNKAKSGIKKQTKKASSSDCDESSGSKAKSEDEAVIEHWVEVFCNSDSRWVPVDVVHGSIGTIVEPTIRDPILYVVGFDHDNCVKDLTRKYASGWLTTVPKQRVNEKWWAETLEPYRPLNREKDLEEDRQIQTKLQKLPLPCSIAEFKNHPLYALKRHLLKFQAIYPSDAPTLGFVKGEPVYARECVQALHSRETWLREARMVRVNEKPYKIVKARPKYDKFSGQKVTDQPLELFGMWQTEEYMPPIAFDGKVPRNAYGNVEMFKPSMLPIGTVHLQVPGLCRVASKLGIDCAPAVIGFEGHHRGSHPVFDGWIVCEEFRDTLMEAWAEEQSNIEKKQAEKREKRIYGNWRRLIKGVLIRERLRAKYLDDD
ncbi:DNA repair protein complementing XP-C cells homolog [Ornithodoros turicata]|uniref:DNA repair protein complementing XP-C cells homolog n=1 Tax=Ornithodoros turicata TaxID=34597 RepID=UPI003139E8C5